MYSIHIEIIIKKLLRVNNKNNPCFFTQITKLTKDTADQNISVPKEDLRKFHTEYCLIF